MNVLISIFLVFEILKWEQFKYTSKYLSIILIGLYVWIESKFKQILLRLGALRLLSVFRVFLLVLTLLFFVRVTMIIVLGLNHNAEFREVESLALVSVEFKKSSYDLVYELLQLFLSDVRISELFKVLLGSCVYLLYWDDLIAILIVISELFPDLLFTELMRIYQSR